MSKPADLTQTDSTHAARVAAEVAARYGVPVDPSVVKSVPPSASGLPPIVWDGRALVFQTPVNPFRRRIRADYQRHKVAVETAPSEIAIRRRAEVARLHAQGLFDAQIMAQMGVSLNYVRSIRSGLGLESNGLKSIREVGERRVARVIDMLRRGFLPHQAAAAENLTEDTVRKMARDQLGLVWRRGVRVEVGQITKAEARSARQAALPDLVAERLCLAEIAARLQVSAHTVSKDLAQLGLSVLVKNPGRLRSGARRGAVAVADRRQAILDLCPKRLTNRQMAARLGLSYSTLRAELRAMRADGVEVTRPDALQGLDTQTARRIKVAALVRAGATLSVIARDLLVSRATVRADYRALIEAGDLPPELANGEATPVAVMPEQRAAA